MKKSEEQVRVLLGILRAADDSATARDSAGPAETAQKHAADENGMPPTWKGELAFHWPRLPKDVRDEIRRMHDDLCIIAEQSTRAQEMIRAVHALLRPYFIPDYRLTHGRPRSTQESPPAVEVERHIAEFARTHRHFQAVRHVMADLLERAASEGADLTLEEAYEQAVRQHPLRREGGTTH